MVGAPQTEEVPEFFALSSAQKFHQIVSGQQRGLSASLLRAGLRCAAVPYACGVYLRNRRFDTKPTAVEKVGVPVISVGNLTLGGTGKTPFVEYLARWFRSQGVRVVLLSRGYGAEAGARNDEALELEQRLPDVPHVQMRNRVAGARLAIEEYNAELIILDDGFQHRRLARNLDIVLLDATVPFGYGHLFPRGLLREPISSLRRADVVVLSRRSLVDEAERHRIRERVAPWINQAIWLEVEHAPIALRDVRGEESAPSMLAGQRVAAFAGIGNPAAFQATLAALGTKVVGFREFPDHHSYGDEDVQRLSAWAYGLDVSSVVCTHKDLVKVKTDELGPLPLWALQVGVRVTVGEELLRARLRALLPAVLPSAGD